MEAPIVTPVVHGWSPVWIGGNAIVCLSADSPGHQHAPQGTSGAASPHPGGVFCILSHLSFIHNISLGSYRTA